MALKVGEVYVEASIKDSGFNTGMKAMTKTVKNTEVKVVASSKRMRDALRNIAWRIRDIGTISRAALAPLRLMAPAFRELGNELNKSTQTAEEFQKEVANISTIMTEQDGNINNVSKSLLNMDNRLGSATELAQGMYMAMSSGAKDAEAGLQITEQAAVFATAGLTNMKSAVDVLTSATNAYAGSNLTANRAADILFKTVEEGKVTGDELAKSIGKTIPLASAYGVSLEEVGAAVATLTRSGENSRRATTQVNAVMRAFIKPSTSMKIAVRKLRDENIKTAEQLLKKKGLAGAIDFLKETAGDSGTKLAALTGRIRGLRGATGLMTQDGSVFNELLDKIKNSAGAANTALEKQELTTKTFNNTINEARIRVGTIANVFKFDLIRSLTGVVEKFNDFIKTEEGVSFFSTIFETIKKNIDLTIGAVGNFIERFKGAKSTQEIAEDISRAIDNVFTAISGVATVFEALLNTLGFLIKPLEILYKAITDLDEPMKTATSTILAASVAMGILFVATGPLGAAIAGLAIALGLLIKKNKEFNSLPEMTKRLEGLKKEEEMIQKRIKAEKEFQKEHKKGIRTTAELEDRFSSLNKELKAMPGIFSRSEKDRERIREIKKEMEEINEEMVKSSRAESYENTRSVQLEEQLKGIQKERQAIEEKIKSSKSEVTDEMKDQLTHMEKLIKAMKKSMNITIGGGGKGDKDEPGKSITNHIINFTPGDSLDKLAVSLSNFIQQAKDKFASMDIGQKVTSIIGAVGGVTTSALSIINTQMSQKMTELKSTHKKELDEMVTNHETAMEKMLAKYDSTIGEMGSITTQLTALNNAEYAEDLQNLQEKVSEAITAGDTELQRELQREQAKMILERQKEQEEKKRAKEKAALEKEQASAKLALEKKQAKEKNDLAEKLFKAKKANDIASVWSNLAVAAAKAFAELGPVGGAIANAIILGGVGVAQTAIINKQKFVPQYKDGTSNARRGLALVGEEGPELVRMSGGEDVFTASETSGMLGGITININHPVVRDNADIDTLTRKISEKLGRQFSLA